MVGKPDLISKPDNDDEEKSNRKKILTKKQKVLILSAEFVICFIILEIIARIFFPNPQTITVTNLNPNPQITTALLDKIGLTKNDIYYRTPTGLRLHSNIKGTIINHDQNGANVEIVTNSLGYRNREIGQKSDQDFRILVLGDSITYGEYLPVEKTYPSILEKYLREHPPKSLTDKNIETINAGVGIIGTETELAILNETGLSTKPDVIFVELYLNDAQESLSLKLIKMPPLLQKSRLINVLVDKINLIRKQTIAPISNDQLNADSLEFMQHNKIDPVSSDNWQKDPAAFNRLIAEQHLDWGYGWTQNFWKKEADLFSVYQQIAQNNHAKLIVTLFPTKYQVQSQFLNDYPQRKFEEIMSQHNITHFDLLPPLREKYTNDHQNIFYDQCHPTAEGMKFIGEKLGESMSQNF